jgi:2-heptyl-3-hydroxy-4(1H)-quinolone synthase
MLKILIVGGGIGGLTLINALREQSVEVTLVERSATVCPSGAGIVIHPNGMSVLARLGLALEVLKAGVLLNQLELIRGSSTLTLSIPEIWRGAKQPSLGILRTELHSILTKAVTVGRTNIEIRMGTSVCRIDEGQDKPLVTFSDGTQACFDLVVGADGINSSVRQSLYPDVAPMHTGLLYFRFIAKNSINLPENTWRTYEGNNGSFGFIPIGRDLVHCFVQLRTQTLPCAMGEETHYLHTALSDWHPELAATIGARSGKLHVGPALMMHPNLWGQGRTVLLGDAAHAVAPTLSEGGSLAMEDALLLAKTLQESADPTLAVAAYVAARDPPVRWAQRMSLSQVNALRRVRTHVQADARVAMLYMQHMYAPLITS